MREKNELRILQYNVQKSRNKVMMTLFQERDIRDYDILMINEPWRPHDGARTYSPAIIGFTLADNGGRTCFYINRDIDSNS